MTRKHTLTALSLGAVVFGLAACTSTPTPTPSVVATTPISASSPTSTPTPSATPSDDPVTAAVKTTVIGYNDERDKILQSVENPPLTGLHIWATQNQVLKDIPALKSLRATGHVEGNSVVTNIEVSSPADHGAGPEVTATYCFDSSAAKLIQFDGSVEKFDAPRSLETAVVRLVGGKWLVDDISSQAKEC